MWLLLWAKASKFYPAKKHMIEAVEAILKMEEKNLVTPNNPNWNKVERGRLAPFAEQNRIDTLVIRFVGTYTHDDIENWTYARVYSQLYYLCTYATVEHEYNELKK
jgi:hypothetical protein